MKTPGNFLNGLLMATLFSCTLMVSSQQSEWTWQNPLPQGNWLRDVKVIDANLIFATGQGGTVMKTIDGGAIWTICKTGTTKLLRRSKFLQNGLVGYASGANSSLIKTTDGGVTWQALNINEDLDLYAMDFPDEQTGFVGGYPGNRVLKTTDGGDSWSQSEVFDISGFSVIKFPFHMLMHSTLFAFQMEWTQDTLLVNYLAQY